MHCSSKFFSIPFRYTVRFGNSMAMVQYFGSTCTSYMGQYRDAEEMSSASSIVDGPVKERCWVRKFLKK